MSRNFVSQVRFHLYYPALSWITHRIEDFIDDFTKETVTVQSAGETSDTEEEEVHSESKADQLVRRGVIRAAVIATYLVEEGVALIISAYFPSASKIFDRFRPSFQKIRDQLWEMEQKGTATYGFLRPVPA